MFLIFYTIYNTKQTTILYVVYRYLMCATTERCKTKIGERSPGRK